MCFAHLLYAAKHWSWVDVIENIPELFFVWIQWLYLPNPTIGVNSSKKSCKKIDIQQKSLQLGTSSCQTTLIKEGIFPPSLSVWEKFTHVIIFLHLNESAPYLNSNPWILAHVGLPKMRWMVNSLQLDIFV